MSTDAPTPNPNPASEAAPAAAAATPEVSPAETSAAPANAPAETSATQAAETTPPPTREPKVSDPLQYFPSEGENYDSEAPLAAICCKVHNPRTVNIGYWNPLGMPAKEPKTAIPLLQPGDPVPPHGGYVRFAD